MRTRLLVLLAVVLGTLPLVGGRSHASPLPPPPDLWVMNADGTGQRLLAESGTDSLIGMGQPAWSPNGAKIAFAGRPLRIVPVAGGEVRTVTDIENHGPVAWSPDGEWLAFGGYTQEVEGLFLVRPDGTELHHIGPDVLVLHPEWSPDGSMISFIAVTQPDHIPLLQVIEPSGSGLRVLADTSSDASLGPTSWHPGGGSIAYVNDNGVLMIAGLDHTTEPLPTGIRHPFAPSWGSQIALGSAEGPLYVVNPDGSGKLMVASEGSEPDWDPTLEVIAFQASADMFSVDILSVRRDGTALRNLTNTDQTYDFDPAWSPDGTMIAYLSRPKPVIPLDEFHERDLTLAARRGAVLKGRLTSPSSRCESFEIVRIERRRPEGWRRVARVQTDSEGRFAFSPRRWKGRFRASIVQTEIYSDAGNRITCSAARSPVVRTS